MNAYVIRRFGGWDEAASLRIDRQLWLPPVDIAAQGRIAWEPGALRVRLEAREAHIRAEETGPLGRPWEDSCLEFFLSPLPGDGRYVNIEFNPNGCCCLGLGDGVVRTRLIPDRDWLAPLPFRTADGWGIEYHVPFDLLRQLFPCFDPKPGDALRANCYKCGDRTAQPHYLAWNPVTSETPDFHRPQDFGTMVFGE